MNKFAAACACLVTALSISASSYASNHKHHDKVFGDWKVFCEKRGDSKRETCGLVQSITATKEASKEEKDKNKDKAEPKQEQIAQYIFTYDEHKKLRLTEVLPLGLLLQPGTKIVVGESTIVSAVFTTCAPVGCVATAEVSAEELKTILAAEKIEVGVINSEGKQFNIPMSKNGLKEGLEILK